MNQPVALSLDELLGASNATAEFKEAVRALEAKLPQERIRFNPGAPPVKVLRFIMKLLEARPGSFVFIGNGDSAGLHSARYDFNDEIIPIGCSYWARLVETAMPA